MQKTRDLNMSSGSCSGPLQTCVAIAGINAVIDIVIYLIPIAIVWNLQLTRQKKLGVIIIFTLGSLCVKDVLSFS
jgi:Fungal rhodopsin domain